MQDVFAMKVFYGECDLNEPVQDQLLWKMVVCGSPAHNPSIEVTCKQVDTSSETVSTMHKASAIRAQNAFKEGPLNSSGFSESLKVSISSSSFQMVLFPR